MSLICLPEEERFQFDNFVGKLIVLMIVCIFLLLRVNGQNKLNWLKNFVSLIARIRSN